MAQTIDWNTSARVSGGPLLAMAGTQAVDAYDKITVAVAAGASLAVAIAPGNWPSVSFLAINPSQAGPKLSYNNGVGDIVLDGPHFLIGAGAVALLGTGSASLTFKNASAADVSIDLLVGRDATP